MCFSRRASSGVAAVPRALLFLPGATVVAALDAAILLHRLLGLLVVGAAAERGLLQGEHTRVRRTSATSETYLYFKAATRHRTCCTGVGSFTATPVEGRSTTPTLARRKTVCLRRVVCGEMRGRGYVRPTRTHLRRRRAGRSLLSAQLPPLAPRAPPTCCSPTAHLSRGRVAVDPLVAAGKLAAGGTLRARRRPLPPGQGNVGVGTTAEIVHPVRFLVEEHLLVTARQLTALCGCCMTYRGTGKTHRTSEAASKERA